MRQRLTTILFGLLFLAGFLVLCYPTISDQWNTYRQNRLITSYETVLSELEPEDYTREWEAAKAFNQSFAGNNLYGDAFGDLEEELTDTPYWKVLNVSKDGVMGYLSIPKINLRLSVYHGTSEEVLQTGIGHLNGTKLPMGGESTHSVLAAHRGLPSARLFTDIDQLEPGDLFYLHVRGTRIPYNGEEEQTSTPMETMVRSVQNYYMLYLILGLSVTLLVILFMRFLFGRGKTRQTKPR